MSRRYERNIKTISVSENERLGGYKVCVVGCGGLGGYIVEELGRLGIGKITVVDGDRFDETNLNRQLLSTVDLIGQSKSIAAKKRMEAVNPDIEVIALDVMITEENCHDILSDHDIVMDALDNVSARKLLEKHCEDLNIPLVHGAIAGWYGQVSTIFPGDRILEKLYPSEIGKGAEEELGNPSFTPAVIASIQVAEALKVLLGREGILRNKLLSINLLNHEYEVFTI